MDFLYRYILNAFKKMQDALGDWHDCVVLSEMLLRLTLDQSLALCDPTTERKVVELVRFVLRRGNDRQLVSAEVLFDRRQMHGRHGEGDVDRFELGDRHQFLVDCGEVADLHRVVAGPALDRRSDIRVAQLHLGVLRDRLLDG